MGVVQSLYSFITCIPRLAFVRKARRLVGGVVKITLRDGHSLIGELVDVSVSSALVTVRSTDPRSDKTEDVPFSEVLGVELVDLARQQEASALLVVKRLEQRLKISEDGSVELRKLEEFIPRTPGLQSVKDRISCSRTWNPRAVTSKIRPGDFRNGGGSMASSLDLFSEEKQTVGQVEYEQRVSEPLLSGQTYIRETIAPFPPGTYLIDPEDSFSHEVIRLEREICMELQFPEGMSPDAVIVTRSTELTAPEYVTTINIVGGRARFTQRNPAIGASYSLKWLNREDIRRQTQGRTERSDA